MVVTLGHRTLSGVLSTTMSLLFPCSRAVYDRETHAFSFCFFLLLWTGLHLLVQGLEVFQEWASETLGLTYL